MVHGYHNVLSVNTELFWAFHMDGIIQSVGPPPHCYVSPLLQSIPMVQLYHIFFLHSSLSGYI